MVSPLIKSAGQLGIVALFACVTGCATVAPSRSETPSEPKIVEEDIGDKRGAQAGPAVPDSPPTAGLPSSPSAPTGPSVRQPVPTPGLDAEGRPKRRLNWRPKRE